MSLITRYRPATLSEMVGNGVVCDKVQAWLKNEKRSHSILLTGPSGCGKTTIARIMATELGCKGGDYDEMDTADFRGIDSMRDLRSKIPFLPMESDCRVYLLDECHKLTNDAQNALLKALEEPPGHVYIILATTNPEKLLRTIKTRCTTFTVNPVLETDLFKFITGICKQEGIRPSKQTRKDICSKAGGSPREALSLLEQIAGLEDPDVEVTSSEKVEAQSIDLCRALMKKKPWKEITRLIKEIEAEPESIRQHIMAYANSCLLNNDQKAYLILEPFLVSPFYDAGKIRLTACCYEALLAE